ncbi:Lrp/AsnC family transcriptional regulator [Glaciihabitans tibetensis]|uniref:Lrp/AsnC family transcriptional regulator n=1 Tax=Glaciihabitans tibetensis TaxID=1266600 RepID=UPI000D04A171|nr:Lrp/AsnC family transcriptional regulator [Glaciihabitans tibetensis]
MPTIDSLDARLLLALDEDPDATVLALSRTLGIARNTVQGRLRRLGESGALRETSRRVNAVALGYGLVAFVSIAISQVDGDLTTEGLAELPEVVEIHSITGDADLLVKVVARDTEDLLRVTRAVIGVPGVVRTNTAVSLSEAMPLRMRALLEAAAAKR